MYEWIGEVFKQEVFRSPVKIQNDSDYLYTLETKFSELNRFMKVFDVPKEIRDYTSLGTRRVIKAVKYYYKGDLISAHTTMKKFLKELLESELAITSINDSTAFNNFSNLVKSTDAQIDNTIPLHFFRARISNAGTTLGKEDMYHIPFNNRQIIKSQRFSIPGLPCLYFSTSSYGCWMEMNRPSSSTFNVSAFEIDNSLKILNVCVTSTDLIKIMNSINAQNYNLKVDPSVLLKSAIEMWILSFASSFRVQHKGDFFRSDYIIPQILMLSAHKENLDGVAYLTKTISSDEYAYPTSINLALFSKYNGEEQLSSICVNMKNSVPVNYEEYLQLSATQKHSRFSTICNIPCSKVEFAGDIMNYQQLEFSKFDTYLLKLLKDSLTK